MTFDKLKSRKRETIETTDEHNRTWEIKKLGEVCQVQRGLTYSGKDTVDISDQVVLRATNIDLGTGKLIFDELKYLREDLEIKPVYALKKDSLLICFSSGSKSHLGKIALVDDDYPNFFFGGFIGQINPSEKIDSKYLFYCLSSETYKDYISNLTDGVNINNLKATDLKSFQIPLPPLPEQQRIVAILDETFSAIDKAKANAEQNLKNAKELFESYLQGVFENGNNDWEVKCLDELGTITSSKRIYKSEYVKEGVPFYRTKEIKELSNGNPITLELFISRDRYEQIKKSFGVPQIGDLLMSAVGTIGEIMVIENEDEFYFKDGNIVWFKDFQRLDTNYLKYALTAFVEKIKSLAIGSAYSALTIEKLNKYEIAFPKTKEEQQTIVRQLDALRAETQKLEAVYQKKIADLEELKKSILQKAFAGELKTEKAVAV